MQYFKKISQRILGNATRVNSQNVTCLKIEQLYAKSQDNKTTVRDIVGQDIHLIVQITSNIENPKLIILPKI